MDSLLDVLSDKQSKTVMCCRTKQTEAVMPRALTLETSKLMSRGIKREKKEMKIFILVAAVIYIALYLPFPPDEVMYQYLKDFAESFKEILDVILLLARGNDGQNDDHDDTSSKLRHKKGSPE